ncbi:RICIN domain-containing protein [Streptomyces sp. NPDC001118]|uniref:RICIN domain-containing protein n=1 Tax=unclassified Streptomyces TaxID=2593676 RepID=UPI00332719D9
MKKRLIGVCAASAVLAPVLTLVGTGPAFAADSGVSWRNESNGKYLAYFNYRVRTTSAIGPTSKWFENKQSDGTYTMRHDIDRKCLDSNSRGDVYIGACNGGDYQKWYEIQDSSGWRLKDKATGRVLEVGIDGQVHTEADAGAPRQRWS